MQDRLHLMLLAIAGQVADGLVLPGAMQATDIAHAGSFSRCKAIKYPFPEAPPCSCSIYDDRARARAVARDPCASVRQS